MEFAFQSGNPPPRRESSTLSEWRKFPLVCWFWLWKSCGKFSHILAVSSLTYQFHFHILPIHFVQIRWVFFSLASSLLLLKCEWEQFKVKHRENVSVFLCVELARSDFDFPVSSARCRWGPARANNEYNECSKQKERKEWEMEVEGKSIIFLWISFFSLHFKLAAK